MKEESEACTTDAARARHDRNRSAQPWHRRARPTLRFELVGVERQHDLERDPCVEHGLGHQDVGARGERSVREPDATVGEKGSDLAGECDSSSGGKRLVRRPWDRSGVRSSGGPSGDGDRRISTSPLTWRCRQGRAGAASPQAPRSRRPATATACERARRASSTSPGAVRPRPRWLHANSRHWARSHGWPSPSEVRGQRASGTRRGHRPAVAASQR